ncbi:RagB/SusD family nutrient uptake outer membrane protein [Sphingobacterium detergens]|uniref:SusD-like starch-binding protein associating with outer membrane n=1 Tax=Sphingobacterium detergens TaxID=1145106 RepID=A0A420B7D9_SPHD1|nr:RagB/SusD family nutrient uptake outer membrane protein [Sphingobacterium detergens]RKE52611.1 SusD-like starch-binding protein associating with outer membrane [Sphingobacterium detergens]
MLKLKYILIGSIAFASLFSSCQKQTFEKPYSYLEPEEAFLNAERIAKTATGMYDALQNRDFLGGRALIYADIRAIDCSAGPYFVNVPNYENLTSNDLMVQAGFVGGYRTIYEANYFLKNIEKYKGRATPEDEAKYIAEAKFIRALSYFYIVNLWAQPYKFTNEGSHPGVALVLKAVDPNNIFDASNQVPRNTVKEVYDQIIKDLNEALPALPKVPATATGRNISNVGRATQGAVNGLLARVYLYKQDYTKALEYANKVVTSNEYTLVPAIKDIFTDYTTTENMFSVAHSGGDNPNTNHSLSQHYSPGGRADIQVSPIFQNLMSTNDARRKDLLTTTKDGIWNAKYNSVSNWVPILRFSEILLTKAEALANLETGTTANVEALTLVNQVRHRSDPSTTVTASNKAELIAAVLKERRIELAFEGQGIYEFLRTGRNIPAHGIFNEQVWGSNKVIFPFPYSETQQNPNLVQNPGY